MQNDDDDIYIPRLPTLMPPAAPNGLEGEQRRLNRARTIRGPLSSMLHRLGERSSRKALESTARRFVALEDVTLKFIGAVEAMGEAREVSLKYQVQGELARLRHDFAVQHAITALHIAWNLNNEALHKAQRAAITARNGADAAIEFKDAKFRLGQVRAEARIAETAELLEPQAERPAAAPANNVAEFFRLRDELRADGIDTDDPDMPVAPPTRKARVTAK
jgi:hypothetical protein